VQERNLVVGKSDLALIMRPERMKHINASQIDNSIIEGEENKEGK
jgi:hypothetical protein